jgi:DNA-binding NarL/FixJ family response regulator
VTSALSAAPAAVVTKTVLVCDHHPMIRRSLTAQFTGNRSYLRVVRAVPDGPAAVDAFTSSPTDMVLIGVRRGTSSGTDAVGTLSQACPSAPIIVFGSAQDSPLLIAAISLGACGLMLWDIDHPLPHQPPEPSTRPDQVPPRALTDVERDLLHRISEGQPNAEIAHKMYLSEQAVKTRCRSLFRKLGAQDRAHAVAIGLRDGLLT